MFGLSYISTRARPATQVWISGDKSTNNECTSVSTRTTAAQVAACQVCERQIENFVTTRWGGSTALVVRMTRSFVFLRDRESKIVVASNYASQVTVPDDEDEETALLCVGKIHQKCHPRLRHLAMQLAFGSRWRICHSTADASRHRRERTTCLALCCH